jgi:hypothetical protein
MKIRHVRVPYQILELDVSNETKAVYIAVMSFRSKNNKRIKVSMKTIANAADLKVRRVNYHITELCIRNVLSRKQVKIGNDSYGCNTYTINCDEQRFAEIPWCIAFEKHLKSSSLIAYCTMKKHTDIRKGDYTCYLSQSELAEYLNCSLNHVNKIKQDLRNAGLISYEYSSRKIVLTYERQINSNNRIYNN